MVVHENAMIATNNPKMRFATVAIATDSLAKTTVLMYRTITEKCINIIASSDRVYRRLGSIAPIQYREYIVPIRASLLLLLKFGTEEQRLMGR